MKKSVLDNPETRRKLDNATRGMPKGRMQELLEFLREGEKLGFIGREVNEEASLPELGYDEP